MIELCTSGRSSSESLDLDLRLVNHLGVVPRLFSPLRCKKQSSRLHLQLAEGLKKLNL
jgi:hypothetical protein